MRKLGGRVANDQIEDAIQVSQVIKLDLNSAGEIALALDNSYLSGQSSSQFDFGRSHVGVSMFPGTLARPALTGEVSHPTFGFAYRPIVFDNFLRQPPLINGIRDA